MRIVADVPEGNGRAVGCGDAVTEAMGNSIKLPKEINEYRIRITEKRKWGESQRDEESGRGRVLLELLDVALFDLLHEAFTFGEVTTKIGGKLVRDFQKLIVNDFRKRDGAASGNQVRAPLEDQPHVPQSKEKQERRG